MIMKMIQKYFITYGPQRKITCLRGYANSKAADQPAALRSLVNSFVISLLESISKLVTSEISIF